MKSIWSLAALNVLITLSMFSPLLPVSIAFSTHAFETTLDIYELRRLNGEPSGQPSAQPSVQPSAEPSGHPSAQPSGQPSAEPSGHPSAQPSGQPSGEPSGHPSAQPSGEPSSQPSSQPSAEPSGQPSAQPSTSRPSSVPSGHPSSLPTIIPTCLPTSVPSSLPTSPSSSPSVFPSLLPSSSPSWTPTSPSSSPSSVPSTQPSAEPTSQPTNPCQDGSSGEFCNICLDQYYHNPVDNNACTHCSEEFASYSIVGVVFIVTCVGIYALKYYFETSAVTIYNHDVYHTDTWLVKWKIHQKQCLIRRENKGNIQQTEMALRAANADMLLFDTEMESVLDALWGKIKIHASFFQLVALLPLLLGESLYFNSQTLCTHMAVVDLNFPLTFAAECTSWDYDFVDILFLFTLIPLAVCGGLLVFYNFFVNLSTAPLMQRRQWQSRCLVSFFVWSFLSLPMACNVMFRMLAVCDEVETELSGDEYEELNGEPIPSFLSADGSLECGSSRYKMGVRWAYAMVVVYAGVLPLIYTYLIYCDAHHMKTRNNVIYQLDEFKTSVLMDEDGQGVVNKRATQERQLSLQPLKFLFASYHPRYCYWEIIETYRRVLLCGIIVVCQQGDTFQLAVACGIAAGCIILYSHSDVYQSPSASLSSHITLWQILGMFFVLLLASDEEFSANRREQLDIALVIVLLIGIPLEVIVYFLPATWYSSREKYISIHAEVQMTDDTLGNKEYDDDYEMSFAGEALLGGEVCRDTGGVILSRSESALDMKDMGLIQKQLSSSSQLSPSPSQPLSQPLSQSLSQSQPQTDSLQHWTMKRSPSAISQQSPHLTTPLAPTSRQQMMLSKQLSSKKLSRDYSFNFSQTGDSVDVTNMHRPSHTPNSLGGNGSGSGSGSGSLTSPQPNLPQKIGSPTPSAVFAPYLLRGPALEHAFQQEIQKYDPVVIHGDDIHPITQPSEPSDLAMPSFGGEDDRGKGRSIGGKRDSTDDRERKFTYTTPLRAELPPQSSSVIEPVPIEFGRDECDGGMNVLTPDPKHSDSHYPHHSHPQYRQTSSQNGPVDIGGQISTPAAPVINKTRSMGKRPASGAVVEAVSERQVNEVSEGETDLEALREEMARERDQLLRENEKMKSEITNNIGVVVTDEEDVERINALMLEELNKLNAENQALTRSLENDT